MFFCVCSLHINTKAARKASVAATILLTMRQIMLSEKIDSVAGDLNGANWYHKGTNVIRDVIHNILLPLPAVGPPLWGPRAHPRGVEGRLRVLESAGNL